jgi:hypothetical protein
MLLIHYDRIIVYNILCRVCALNKIYIIPRSFFFKLGKFYNNFTIKDSLQIPSSPLRLLEIKIKFG